MIDLKCISELRSLLEQLNVLIILTEPDLPPQTEEIHGCLELLNKQISSLNEVPPHLTENLFQLLHEIKQIEENENTDFLPEPFLEQLRFFHSQFQEWLSEQKSETKKPQEIDYSFIVNVEEDGDVLNDFVIESREHLEVVETACLALEENPHSEEMIESIFRAFHSFKGMSGFLSLKSIHKIAHEIESLLEPIREKSKVITSEWITLILSGGDLLRSLVEEIAIRISEEDSKTPIDIPIQPLLLSIEQALSENPLTSPSPVVEKKVKTEPSENNFDSIISSSVVRVDLQEIDKLLDTVREILVVQEFFHQEFEKLSDISPKLENSMLQLTRFNKELQLRVMKLRRVPVSHLFQKMQRLIRDLSLQQNKKVEIQAQGQETEIDRRVLELLADPLMHMIRNAIDHGIEAPEERKRKGKKEAGLIVLHAEAQTDQATITLQDDGRGLNSDAILTKACESGLISSPSSVKPEDIFQLIFEPGFSTVDQVNEISGRGVGMDVVKKNIKELGGKIEIESIPDAGTIFKLTIPLSMVLMEGLVVRIAHHKFIIPSLAVSYTFRPSSNQIFNVEGENNMIESRDRLYPFIHLASILRLPSEAKSFEDETAIIVQATEKQAALRVDELMGKQEVVLKPIGEGYIFNRYFDGAAVLRDGTIGFVLNIETFLNLNPQNSSKPLS